MGVKNLYNLIVPRTGVEPALLSKYAPETYASTNSAIGAKESDLLSMGAQDKSRTCMP